VRPDDGIGEQHILRSAQHHFGFRYLGDGEAAAPDSSWRLPTRMTCASWYAARKRRPWRACSPPRGEVALEDVRSTTQCGRIDFGDVHSLRI